MTDRLSRAQKIVAICVGVMTIVGTCAAYTAASARMAVQVMEIERRPRVDSIAATLREEHSMAIRRVEARQDSITYEILRKLDCALFELPRGCRDQLSPR